MFSSFFLFSSHFFIFLSFLYLQRPYFIKDLLKVRISDELVTLSLGEFFKFQFLLTLMLNFIYYFIKEVETTMFHEFFYQIKDKINLKT